MQTQTPEVTWRQFGGIVGICLAIGTIMGAVWYLGLHEPRMLWTYLPLVLLVAFVIALPFALIAGVFAALVLIVFTKSQSAPASRVRKVLVGALTGAAIGVLHPIVLLLFVIEHWTLAPTLAVPAWFAGVTAASGLVSGAVVFLAYADSVRHRVVAS